MPIFPNSPHTFIHMYILASSRDKRCSSDWLHTERCAKDASKPADGPTPPMVSAAHESFTWTNLQGDCGDAANASTTAPGKEHVADANDKKFEAMPPPIKKRSASCRGEECEDDEESEECTPAIKLRRGEIGEEGKKNVTTTCHNPGFDPDKIVEKYIQGEREFGRRLV